LIRTNLVCWISILFAGGGSNPSYTFLAHGQGLVSVLPCPLPQPVGYIRPLVDERAAWVTARVMDVKCIVTRLWEIFVTEVVPCLAIKSFVGAPYHDAGLDLLVLVVALLVYLCFTL
jgi:hypothetical protein